jgi:hypothetical protein
MNKIWLAIWGTTALNACVLAPGEVSDAAPESTADIQQDIGITVRTTTVGVTLTYSATDVCNGEFHVTADGKRRDAEWTFDFYRDGVKVGSFINDPFLCGNADPLCEKPSLKVPVLSTPANYHVEVRASTQSWLLNRKYKGTSNLVAVRPQVQNCGFPPSSRPAFAWSGAGPIPAMFCTNVNEGADPHTWADNFFCSFDDVGLQFSSAGPVPGKACTSVDEPGDPHTWVDNYICSNGPRFSWWYDGAPAGARCVQWSESADPHGWDDNFLCY